MCDEDGKLFIKPCTQKEIDFYQTVQHEALDPAESKEKFRNLLDIMPVFMGTLTLQGATDSSLEEAVAGVISEAGGIKTNEEDINKAVSDQATQASSAPEAHGHG